MTDQGEWREATAFNSQPCYQQQQQLQQPPSAINNQVPRQRDDKVVMVREFNTFAVCSACEQPVKMFHVKHRGVAVRKTKRERLKRMGEPVPVLDKAKLTESHQFVRCNNNACTKCWQRDKLLRLEQTRDNHGPMCSAESFP